MSSPSRITDGSASISSRSASEIAPSSVRSGMTPPPGLERHDRVVGEDAPDGVGAVGRRALLGELDGVVDLRLHALGHRLALGGRRLQRLLQARDRILLAPLLE